MSAVRGIFFLLLLVSSAGLKAQDSFTTSEAYVTYILDRITTSSGLIYKAGSIAKDSSSNPGAIKSAMAGYRKTSDQCLKEVKKMPAWKGNTEVRDAGVKVLKLMDNTLDDVMSKYIQKIISKKIKPSDKVAYDKWSAENFATLKKLLDEFSEAAGRIDKP